MTSNPMNPWNPLELLRAEIEVFSRRLREADLSAPITSCPGWTVRDLAIHLGGIHRWVIQAITHGELLEEEPGFTEGDLISWFAAGSQDLLAALDADPAQPATTFAPDKTVGFWQRRQLHEHRIHRWDLENALGRAERVEAMTAHDGLDEIATMFWPRQVMLGRAAMPERGLRIQTLDTGGSWDFGRVPAATLSGAASDLVLAVWHRVPVDQIEVTWTGDHAHGQDVLSLALAP